MPRYIFFPFIATLSGKKCLNLICTSFFGPLKANICILKKKHEYKLMIFGSNSNVTFDIQLLKRMIPIRLKDWQFQDHILHYYYTILKSLISII
uniref:Uncharacterized protein n=1 Tax=Panagrolaimus superbus TaxID=310955 RepID=A0A914YGA1_9BILA